MKTISLFSGIGGFDLGFVKAGANIVCATDIDKSAIEYYQLNFKNHRVICNDIRNLSGTQLTKDLIIDVVIGGSPCQGFSISGKLKVDDIRNDLIFEYSRLVLEIQPRYFVFENVPNLLSDRYSKLFNSFIEDLYTEYDFKYQILNTVNYGVPQKRKRLILIGWRNGEIEPSYPQIQIKQTTVREALKNVPDYRSIQHSQQTIEMLSKIKSGEASSVSRTCRRLYYDLPAHTITASLQSIHPEYHRHLNNREAARLQTFPDNFLFSPALSVGKKQIGNAVPPEFAYAIAQQIKKVL